MLIEASCCLETRLLIFVIPFYYGSGPVPLRKEVTMPTVPVPQHYAASRVTHVLILNSAFFLFI
jgi:hypothetical protein